MIITQMVYEPDASKGKNIHLKLPADLIERIDRRVNLRQFESRPDFVKIAVRLYLDHLDEVELEKLKHQSDEFVIHGNRG